MASKNSENELETLQRENSRLRGDLLTIGRRVAHDLRTPLGSILISIELLKEAAAKNDVTATAAKSLLTSVDEISRLIKSVSLFAKATANPPAMEMISMMEIVSAILAQAERKITARGATVSAPDSWPEVSGISNWLEFVWYSFLDNALLHGGKKILLGWRREKNEFHFSICDDGKTISAATRERLFQPFDSLHAPDSTRGVSLSIIQRLVELQGGHCGYELTGEGHPCFYFTLPAGN
jgi:signal transduction histidine kinase